MNEKQLEFINEVNEFVRGNQDWLDDVLGIGQMADDNTIVYVVDSHEQYEAIEDLIRKFEDDYEDCESPVRVEFYDELRMCVSCNHYVYTTPTSAFWHQDWWESEEGLVCNSCVKNSLADEYLEYLTNNYKNANVVFDHEELTKFGWVRLEHDYQTGMNYGYQHEPKRVYDHLKDQHENMLFSITSVTPFDTEFSVYVKKDSV